MVTIKIFSFGGYADEPDATTGQQGLVFSFQLPFNYVGNMDDHPLEVMMLILTIHWCSSVPPLLLTAGGQQLFWSVSCSQFHSWVDTQFSVSASGSASFDHGIPYSLLPKPVPPLTMICPQLLCALVQLDWNLFA
jgi:hypothetical protein